MTASLLRLGTDTAAARACKTHFPSGVSDRAAPEMLGRICEALSLRGADRTARLEQARREAGQAIDAARRHGIAVLTFGEPTYPFLLQQIPDPPIALWLKGRPELLQEPGVAIVGSRRASGAGIATATHLARDVSRAGLVVTSGLARGIDGAAHRGALDVDGSTIGVLGSGLDVVYPAEHRPLAQIMADRGLLVSEFPPGTRPYPNHFPLRNRVISGLSRAVVVVEASERSGSLITAKAALEQGRDVLAVPGSIASGSYRGCHALIKEGARLVESVEDILEEIRWTRPQAIPNTGVDNRVSLKDLENVIRPGEVLTLDAMAARSGLAAPDLLAALGRQEVAGRIRRMAGGTFARLD